MSNINHTRTNVEDLLLQIARLLEKLETDSISDGFFFLVSSTDAAAPVNSVYYSTDTSKATYKDPAGVTHVLY